MSSIRIEGSFAYITLTKGHEAMIDAADVPLVEGFNWRAMAGSHTVYATSTDRSGPKPRTVYLHRLLMSEPKGMEVDHRDNNGLRNTRTNLRVATRAQNNHNTRPHADSASRLKGVSWSAAVGKWRARIMLDLKERHLGYFDCPTAAYLAYVKASAQFHGAFGRVA